MATEKESGKELWMHRGKLTLYGLVGAGIGVLIGLYLLAPMQAKSDAYVPSTVKKMGTTLAKFENPEGNPVFIPVKLADEDKEREQGLNGVGKEALENTYVLYDQGDVTTWGEDYETEKIKAPISFAVINGDGEVVEIKEAKESDDEVSVEKDHRWVLAMETGLMDKYGITKGSKLFKSSLPTE